MHAYKLDLLRFLYLLELQIFVVHMLNYIIIDKLMDKVAIFLNTFFFRDFNTYLKTPSSLMSLKKHPFCKGDQSIVFSISPSHDMNPYLFLV